MDYMTLKEAAEKWGVTPRRVNYYCAAGISGLLGGSGSLNVNRTTTAINQAFTQSPYLKK